jgi:hypothetical protein
MSYRLVLVYSKLVDEFLKELAKNPSAYHKECIGLQAMMIRIFNELIAKVNQNAPLLPRELINYAKHYVLKGRHELEEVVSSLTKSN